MGPTPRAALLLLVVALVALVVPVEVTLVFAAFAVGTIAIDIAMARRPFSIVDDTPKVAARGVPARLHVAITGDAPERVQLRQANAPDLTVEPETATGALDAHLVAHRRGRHQLPPIAARRTGPLGLGSWTRRGAPPPEFVVYPDVPAAQRLVIALRQGRFRDPGQRTRGPLGLGTDFEAIRDYLPDDDVRQINWRATARLGRPMSNQYRIEQDRDVVCVLDAGRLMGAPIGTMTRLDAAVDAVTMVAYVADEIGDRAGVIVFDDSIRRHVTTRRGGGRAVVQTIADVEPRLVDSDYDLAFQAVGRGKRALVVVFTDLVDESAARTLIASVPVLTRRHAVVIASVTDPDLAAAVTEAPTSARDVYGAAVALDVLSARTTVAARLRGMGATVLEAKPGLLGEVCVGAYLRLKSQARL
jgi:uncharacterized protein (DUF58 family)